VFTFLHLSNPPPRLLVLWASGLQVIDEHNELLFIERLVISSLDSWGNSKSVIL
jgi:hypothetical protein